MLSLSQTLEDVTLTLDWAYVDESRLALRWTTSPLPEGLAYDTPSITFAGFTPLQMTGVVQGLRGGNNQMMYVSYQVIQTDAVGEKIDFSVNLPLVQVGNEAQTPVANFHFDLKDIPVFRGMTLNIQQAYAHQINGVEVRLKSVRMMPSFTELIACYDFPNEDAPFWYVQNATIQIDDGPEESYRAYQYLSEITDDHCVKLGFAVGSADESQRLVFRVHKLVVPLTMQDRVSRERIATANQILAANGIEIASAPDRSRAKARAAGNLYTSPEGSMDPAQDPRLLVLHALEENMTGLWELFVDLPDAADFPVPGMAQPELTPTVLGSQTQGDVTVSLDWVFVDALRAGVGYTITGLSDVPDATVLQGMIGLKDDQGKWVGGAGIGSSSVERVAGQPGVLRGTYSVGYLEPLTQPEARFQLEITLDGTRENEWIAAFPISPEATPYPPGVFPPRLPDRLIGTYSFDFTAPVYPLTVLNNISGVTANGLEIQVVRAEATPSMSTVMLCYAKPSGKDWWINRAVIKNGSEEASLTSGTLIYDRDFNHLNTRVVRWAVPPEFEDVEHGRCVTLSFLLGQGNPSENMTLTIPQLEISPPEVVPEAELQVAQEKLNAMGIEMTSEVWRSSGGGGGGGVTFTTLPEGMSQETAYQKYMDALGYVYAGPWVFWLEHQP